MSLFDSIGKFFDNFGGAIGGIASGFGSYAGQNSANQANRDIANATNAANLALSREQMDFQERMSSTAFQRSIQDMKNAGINPMYAASAGGASTPSGAAVGAVTGAPIMNKFSSALDSFNSAVQARTASATLKNIQEDTDKKRSEKHLTDQLKYKAQTDMALATNNAKVASITARQLAAALPGLKTEEKIDESDFGKVVRTLGRLNPFGHSAASIVKAIK